MNNIELRRASRALRSLTLASLLAVPAAGWAGPIALKSADGAINLNGEFVAFENGKYVLDTDLGRLTIDAASVTCEGDDCPAAGSGAYEVHVAGSDTVGLGLMPLLMDGFASFLAAEGQVEQGAAEGEFIASLTAEEGFGELIGSYRITPTVSGDAFAALLARTASIGMASRRIKPEEAKALKADGAGSMIDPHQEHIIAIDSLVVIVNASNPVTSLSMADVARIYAGQVANWSELGGPDLPLTVINFAEGSGTRTVFTDRMYGADAPASVPAQVIAENNPDAASRVAADRSAIAYVGSAFIQGNHALNLVTSCGILATPDAFAVKTEEYPLQRRLYLYTRGDLPDPLAAQFIGFVESSAADASVTQAGFVDLGVVSRDQSVDDPRGLWLASHGLNAFESTVANDMLNVMVNYERLSTTFRFSAGSADLDERAELDLARLASYLETLPSGTEVALVGFSDTDGEFEPNLKVSRDRATTVIGHLTDFAGERLSGITFTALGYGEVAPVACNDSKQGRQINRRVEVWVKKG
jgi:phosphate transport system substrate-binding protein